ncbi:MAG: DUF421 domain-containing protein [Hyphomicrobium sp.]
MFNVTVPWWEFIVRGAAVYGFLFVLLRVTGKRQVGQLAPFDLILLLILSNAVQNSMNAGDNSLIGGLISAATLVAINYALAYAAYRSPAFERFIEGAPIAIVRDGRVQHDVLAEEYISNEDLNAALRLAGSFSPSEVRLAMLETNGHVSILKTEAARAE